MIKQVFGALGNGLNVDVGSDDPWEVVRKELAAQGDIFDSQGNITPQGRAFLKRSHWKDEDIAFMEQVQKNYVGAVEVYREEGERTAGAMSAQNRAGVFADALKRAKKALQEREEKK